MSTAFTVVLAELTLLLTALAVLLTSFTVLLTTAAIYFKNYKFICIKRMKP